MTKPSDSQNGRSDFLTSGFSVFEELRDATTVASEPAQELVRGEFDFSGEHLYQVLPVVEHETGCQDLQVPENSVACPAGRPGFLPVPFRVSQAMFIANANMCILTAPIWISRVVSRRMGGFFLVFFHVSVRLDSARELSLSPPTGLVSLTECGLRPFWPGCVHLPGWKAFPLFLTVSGPGLSRMSVAGCLGLLGPVFRSVESADGRMIRMF